MKRFNTTCLQAVLLGLMVITGQAFAYNGDGAHSCWGCSESGYKSKAHNSIDNGYVVIFDLHYQELRKFKVTTESEPGFSWKRSVKFPPSSAEVAWFSGLTQKLGDLEAAAKNVYDVPPEVAGSVYDLLGNASLASDVMDLRLASGGLGQRVDDFIYALGTAALPAFDLGHIIPIVYVKFSDGSIAAYSVAALVGATVMFEFRPDLSVGPEGNSVPEDVDGLRGAGDFVFDERPDLFDSSEALMSAAERFGFNVRSEGVDVYNCSPRMVCRVGPSTTDGSLPPFICNLSCK